MYGDAGEQRGWLRLRDPEWIGTAWQPRPTETPLATAFSVLKAPRSEYLLLAQHARGAKTDVTYSAHRAFEAPGISVGVMEGADPADICVAGAFNLVVDPDGSSSFSPTGKCFGLLEATKGRANYWPTGSPYVIGLAPDIFSKVRVGGRTTPIVGNA